MTIGVDFHVKTISIESNEGPLRCKLQIWDTGGQERFSSIRPMYYRGSLGALIIFDLTNYETFEHLPMWIEEVRANVRSDIPLLLVGNKSDLTDQRTVTMEEINDFSEKFHFYYMETSAKTGDGVGDCFSVLACLMIGQGVPDQLIEKEIVYSPGNLPVSGKAHASPQITNEPAFEPEPVMEFSAPPVPEPVPIKEMEPSPSFEPEPEIEFAAPPVPEPAPIKEMEPSPSFEPEPEIEFAAPPVPELKPVEAPTNIPSKKPSQKLEINSSKEFKPETVPFASSTPIPVAPPEDFKLPLEIEQTEIKSTETKPSVPFLASKPKTSDSSSLIDYMPETILSKKEQKELEKQRKLEEKEKKAREAQLAKEEKERLKREAKEEKERAKQEALEEREKAKQEALEEKERAKREALEEKERAKREALEEKERKKREALEEKERKEREALEEKERKEREALEAREAKKAKKAKKSKKEDIIEPEIPPTPQHPDLFKKEEPSLAEALASKTKKVKRTNVFTPFTPIIESTEEENAVFNSIPNIDELEKTLESRIAPSPQTVPFQDQRSQTKKVICKQCGTMLSSDYAFCNKCGAPL